MAKLKEDAISVKDLEEFIDSNPADFVFELQVLAKLRGLGFDCLHSGTYRDPVTSKVRLFDIRAQHHGDNTLAMAVECKNLRPNNPLLISAVPRTEIEAFHELLVWSNAPVVLSASVYRQTGSRSAYRGGQMVGKKCDQVGRESTGVFSSNDEKTFDKVNQAVNSCVDLIRELASKSSAPRTRAVVPVLVVPSDMLWQVEYDACGKLIRPPYLVTHTTLFLNHAWQIEGVPHHPVFTFRLSHLEVLTFDALFPAVEGYFSRDGFFSG